MNQQELPGNSFQEPNSNNTQPAPNFQLQQEASEQAAAAHKSAYFMGKADACMDMIKLAAKHGPEAAIKYVAMEFADPETNNEEDAMTKTAAAYLESQSKEETADGE